MSSNVDKSVLLKIDPLDVQDYLSSVGWQVTDRVENKAVVYSRNDFYSDLIVPISKTASDFALRYAEVVSLLAEFYGKSKQDILQDILYYGADIVKFRIDSPKTQDGTIPIDDAAKFYQNVKQIVISSARSVIEAKPKYSSNIPVRVKDLYDRSRIGQTEVGSYIIAVIIRHAKIQEPSNNILKELPFERLAFENMNKALSAIDAITENGLAERRVDEAIFDGVSYNLCKHLSEIQEITYGGSLDINFQWSKRYDKPHNSVDDVVIEYSQKPSIERAAEILGATTSKIRKTLYGIVIGLLRPEGHKEGKVTIHTLFEGRQIKISIVLSIAKYNEAVRAHETDAQVKFSGEVDRIGNYFYMSKVEKFEVMEDRKLIEES